MKEIKYVRSISSLSLESLNAESGMEREVELYVLAKDINQLMLAQGVEQQEQYGILPPGPFRGSVRVRKSTDAQGTRFEHTAKIKQQAQGLAGNVAEETSEPSTQAMFEAYRELANDGMLKDRFFFPVPNTELVWEVDAFPQADGQYAPWLKLDLELPAGMQLVQLPAIPIQAQQVLVKDPANQKVQAQIDELFKRYFRYNPKAAQNPT